MTYTKICSEQSTVFAGERSLQAERQDTEILVIDILENMLFFILAYVSGQYKSFAKLFLQ
ncbi:hypothetical protein D3Z53_22400 [Lachnospiraceae bacterium]|nr:hypothetical protein [Lachnospiraceae bacterium]